jgi:YHS domain-containing protein
LAKRKRRKSDLYLVIALATLGLAGLAAAALLANQPAPADASQGPINDRSRVCMLQDTLQGRSGLPYVYRGKTYYLCCGGCLAAFQQNAAIYSRAIDPVDGRSVDKADAPAYAYHGHAYYFASASNLAEFAREPKKFIRNRASSLTGS